MLFHSVTVYYRKVTSIATCSWKMLAYYLASNGRNKLTHKNTYSLLKFSTMWLAGGMVASWLVYPHLQIEQSGFELWPGTLCCVLRQDT